MMDKQKRESPPFTSPLSKSNGFKIPKKKADDWNEDIHASSPLTRLGSLDLKNVTVRKRPYSSSYESYNVPRNKESHAYYSSPDSKFMRQPKVILTDILRSGSGRPSAQNNITGSNSCIDSTYPINSISSPTSNSTSAYQVLQGSPENLCLSRTEQIVDLHKEVEKESKAKPSEKKSVEPKDIRVDQDREFVKGFIALYREQECLWFMKGADYSNKQRRQAAYEKLVTYSKTYFCEATVEWVCKKIANLHTVFGKEYKKVAASKCSEAGTDQVYTSNLWFYNDLLFIMEKEPTTKSLVIMAEQESVVVEDSSLTLFPTTPVDLQTSQNLTVVTASQESSSSASRPNPPPKKRSRKTAPKQNDRLIAARKALSKAPPDRFDSFSAYLIQTLRELPKEQQLECERLTSEMSYLAMKGLLCPDTHLLRPGSRTTAPTSALSTPPTSYPFYLKRTEQAHEASLSTVCRDVSNKPTSPQKDLKKNSTEEGGANASKSTNLECKNSVKSNIVGSPDTREKTYCFKRAEHRDKKTIASPTNVSVHCSRDKPPLPSSESDADCSLKSSDRTRDIASRTSRENRKSLFDSSLRDPPMSSSYSYSNRLSRRKQHLQNTSKEDCLLEPIVLSSDEEEREHEENVVGEPTSMETSDKTKEDEVSNKQCPSPSIDVEPMDCSVSILDQPLTSENSVLELKLLSVYYGQNKGKATSSAKVTPKSIKIPLKVSLQQCKCISLDTMKLQRYGLWLTNGEYSVRSSAIIILWITTDYIPHIQEQLGETSKSQASKSNELIFLELIEPLTGKEQSLLGKIMREASESGLPTLADMLTLDEMYSMLEALSNEDCSFKANCGKAFKKQESSNTSPPVAPPEASKVTSSYTLIQKCKDGCYSVSMVPRQEGSLKEVDKGGTLLRLLVYPPPPTKGGLAVTNEDLECLEHGEFLNDVIIDFYLKYLLLENFPKHFAEKCHIFSSFFFRCLTRKDHVTNDNNSEMPAAQRRHHRVKTWTRHVDIFTKDFIFVPVNENSHWYLVVICFPWLEKAVYEDRKEPRDIQDTEKKDGSISGSVIVFNDRLSKKEETKGEESNSESEGSTSSGTSHNPKHSKHKDKQHDKFCKRPCLLIFDSLKTGSAQNTVKVLREYLKVEWDAKRKTPRDFSRCSMRDLYPRVPKQNNSTDCGLYILQYVESFAQKPIESFDSPMHLENWFPASVVKNKRDEIRDLILRLHVQQSKKS